MRLSSMLSYRKLFVYTMILVGTIFLNSSLATAVSVNIKDYYILNNDSHWHYTGSGQTGSTVEDDFTNTVLDELQAIGSINATRIQTITDESTDDMNGNEAFWYVDPTDSDGKLYFCGFFNANEDAHFAVQVVSLSPSPSHPLLIGQNEQAVPSIVTDSSPVDIEIVGFGTVSGTITSRVEYSEIIPVVQTPLGAFTNVLLLRVSFDILLGFETFTIMSGDFFLKENVGMILHDQEIDLDDAQIQAIDSGVANGVVIVPDSSIDYALEDNIKTLQVVSGLEPTDFYLKQDVNENGKAGLDDAVFLLQRSAGMVDLTLESSAFNHLDPIPVKHSADGVDVSPKLTWSNPPAGTLSYALIMDDPDAIQVVGKVWDHWLVYDIPGISVTLEEDAGAFGSANLPAGALHGTNSFSTGKHYYLGPAPPASDSLHRYFFHLYALDVASISPAPDTTKSSIKKAMEGHILGEATLVGTFDRVE